jgi:hypothetical protein
LKSFSKEASINGDTKGQDQPRNQNAQYKWVTWGGRFENSELFKERPIGSANSEQTMSVAPKRMNFCVKKLEPYQFTSIFYYSF